MGKGGDEREREREDEEEEDLRTFRSIASFGSVLKSEAERDVGV
jgi:hypothetical protein